ncbi:MAG TPA: ABC transporter permease [Gammaproteobacteria bacterium]|nr:ABC transporter permease [Gammaproteobacteria bacterium]
MTLLKHAFRQLVLRPALSGTVIAMLALGVGAATAIFSLFYQVLVQPLPVPEPERLVNIVHLGSAPDAPRESFSYPMFRDLEGAQGGAFRIAGHIPFGANVAYEGGAFNVPGVFVSGAYFDVLGLRPALGRLIGPQDEPRVGESAVAVLSYDLWRGRFGGDPGIVGRELTIAGQPLTVVGVAPAGFSGTQLGERTQVFVPITMRWRLTPSAVDTPDGRNFSSVLAPRAR